MQIHSQTQIIHIYTNTEDRPASNGTKWDAAGNIEDCSAIGALKRKVLRQLGKVERREEVV